MIPRQEHPRPQFLRDSFKNLNGIWQFEIDNAKSGEARGYFNADHELRDTITVPFCPESSLSGVKNVDFMESLWYKREFDITKQQLSGRVFLHFGAVDYEATVYVNSKFCGTHTGGYVSFSFDITDLLNEGTNTVTVRANDDTKSRLVPSGKQSGRYHSYECFYTRTTGIWQTVWLEFVPNTYIKKIKIFPCVETSSVTISAELCGNGELVAETFYQGRKTGAASALASDGSVTLTVNLSERHLWEVGFGRLYDLVLSFGDDVVKSYFGLRSVKLSGNRFLINDKPVFQRLILDQGFYPDGIYTAPDDSELIADIDRSIAMGFNGARLHQKVFEERFLYHCDRKGYIVWGEYASWGLDHSCPDAIYSILPEWLSEIDRDFNHPAIIGWCPFNETWDQNGHRQFDRLLSAVYGATKSADPTRPVIDTSGNFHVVTDLYDLHDYEQDPETFKSHYLPLAKGESLTFHTAFADRQQYDGKMPFFVSEYGGIRWSDDAKGWGYGEGPKTEEEFISRLRGLTDALLDDENMFGLCYTQLTDVEQEQNGLYTYDRRPKFPPEIISAIFKRRAAYEKE